MGFPTSAFVAERPEILLVDSEIAIARLTPILSEHFQLNSTPHLAVAAEYITRAAPALVVTDVALQDGTGIDVCRAAKALPVPATVLVTTDNPETVPDALAAGCDGVLLKPFAPNLLFTRIGRLLRERSDRLRVSAARTRGKSAHLSERIELLMSGSNRVWPNTHCPYCAHAGVTSFDFASMRRAWYACLECRKVWIAKRQE